MKKIFVLLFLNFFYFLAFSQNFKIAALEKTLQVAAHDSTRVHILNDIILELLSVDLTKALDYAQQLNTLAKKINDKNAEAISLNQMGNISQKQGDYKKSFDYYKDALAIYKTRNNKKDIAIVLMNIGNVYLYQGNYDKALENYFQSLKTYEEIDNKPKIASCLNNIGAVYYYLNNFDQALEYWLKALEIRQQLGEKKDIGGNLGNIGNIYFNKREYDKAMEYFTQALSLNKELGNKVGIASSYSNIGTIYEIKGNYAKALEHYFQSLKLQEELNQKEDIALSYQNIGTTFQKQGNYNKAILYLNNSLKISLESGVKENIQTCYEELANTFVRMNNYQKAYEYHQLFSQMKDSLFNEESSKQITDMQTKYDTEKKEQQIKLLNKDKEIQNKDLERQKTIRNAVAGGLILVLLFSFVLINRLLLIRKQKKVIEIEREKSEKLLLNILPKEIAEELKRNSSPHPNPLPKGEGTAPLSFGRGAGGEGWLVTPKKYEMVTVMFTDFKGFTTIAEKMSAEELVSELDFIFKKFDEIISKYPIEKIKTIGDAYMCAGGLPVANTTNPMDVVMAGLEIQEWMKSQNKWQLRLGIHTGSVIAGVVGDKKFAYDIWGDTVNTASRMESSGEAGKVNISGSTYNLIKDHLQTTDSQLQTIFRGKIPAKNKGEIDMYFVERT